MLMPTSFQETARELAACLLERGWQCAVAESCTGGLAGAALTDIPGASLWFAGGVISYSNEVKNRLLGVDAEILRLHGAVSEPVVRQMAAGACQATGAQAAVSLSGVAGPDGGTPDKPVGTVWIGVAVNGETSAFCHLFSGDRQAVREQAVAAAIGHLLDAVRSRGAA